MLKQNATTIHKLFTQKSNIQNTTKKQIYNRKNTLSRFLIKKPSFGSLSHSANYMDKIPCINLNYTWEQLPDRIVVIEMPHTGFYHKIAQKYFHKPKKSHIKLDRYGSTLWVHINGDNTVFNLVSIMEEQFPEEAPDMLKRVIAFLETLERVRFIYLL